MRCSVCDRWGSIGHGIQKRAGRMAPNNSDDPYVSEYPPGSKIDPDIQALIRHYYTQVDTKGKHVEYSECWAEDGVLIVPTGKEFRGRDGTNPSPLYHSILSKSVLTYTSNKRRP